MAYRTADLPDPAADSLVVSISGTDPAADIAFFRNTEPAADFAFFPNTDLAADLPNLSRPFFFCDLAGMAPQIAQQAWLQKLLTYVP